VKITKSMFALAMAVAMILSMAMPAIADDHTNHTITINENNSGHTYVAYQIFAGTVEVKDQTTGTAVLSDVDWGDAINPAKVADILSALKHPTNNSQFAHLYTGIEDTLSTKEIAKKVSEALAKENTSLASINFAKIMKNFAVNPKISQKYASLDDPDPMDPDEDGDIACYKITGLNDGYYMIVEAGNGSEFESETRTHYMLRLVNDITIKPKAEKVTSYINIKEGIHYRDFCADNIGDIAEIVVTGSVPEYFDRFQNGFVYDIAVQLPNGISLVESSDIKVSTVNGDSIQEIPSESAYKVYKSDTEISTEVVGDIADKYDDGTDLLVRIYNLAAVTTNAITKDTELILTFKASLNADAITGNFGDVNNQANDLDCGNVITAYVAFSQDPYDANAMGKTVSDSVSVFTFKVDVTKIDGTNQSPLEGVEFKLYRKRTQDETTVLQYATVSNDKISGWTTNEGEAATFTSDDDGKFSIIGLDADTYFLKETLGFVGYNTMEDLEFSVTADYKDNPKKLSLLSIQAKDALNATPGVFDNGSLALTVINNPGSLLPSTGGIGTTIFYVVGGILVAGAAVLLITRKRMEKE